MKTAPIPFGKIKSTAKGRDLIPIPTPGEILLLEFLQPAGISQYRLAAAAGIPASRLTDIIKGRRSITADTAIRLSKTIGMPPQFWLGLQQDYELRVAARANASDYANITKLEPATVAA